MRLRGWEDTRQRRPFFDQRHVLLFERTQSPSVGYRQAAEPRLQFVEGRLAYPLAPTQLHRRHISFLFVQDRDDRLFAELPTFHRSDSLAPDSTGKWSHSTGLAQLNDVLESVVSYGHNYYVLMLY